MRRTQLLAAGLSLLAAGALFAQNNALSDGLLKVEVEPRAGFISGKGQLHGFVVTGLYIGGRTRDLTREATFDVANETIVRQTEPGLFEALDEGVSTVTARFKGQSASAAIVVSPARSKTWEFFTDIAPVFSKFGCNASSCHGALNGQNEFKLSLFGYDPDADYEAVVHKSAGRRIDRKTPEQSLIVAKPTFAIPHGGGQRFSVDAPEYHTLLEWIQAGAPKGDGKGPRLTSLEIAPAGFRVLDEAGDHQQLIVIGHYSDNSQADVTRSVQYVASDDTVAEISPLGLVTAKTSGETNVLVRSMGQLASTRIGVAQPVSEEAPQPPRRNFVDEFIFSKLDRMRIPPAPVTGDAQFLRRVYLDLIGTLPTEDEVNAFVTDDRADKRHDVIDALLTQPQYGQFWAQKWGDLFMLAPLQVPDNSLYAHEYFRRNFAQDKPYDEVAREMITALGSVGEIGPANFYTRTNRRVTEEYATFVSQTFLGVSLECARCHDHPRERWTRDDFLGTAAFFSQVKIKEGLSYKPFEYLVTLDYPAEFKHPQTLQVVRPRLLGGIEPPIRPMTDRRQVLAAWLTAPENPFFARATVNRIWKELMGRGLVEPTDDFRATNPPSHPELLDRLAAFLVENGYRLKPLMALISKSATYQLASAANAVNAEDGLNYSHYAIRRLRAEQLLDAVSDVTGVPEKFPGFYRGKRAIDLPDSGVNSYFLEQFDRSPRDVASCTRLATTTVSQAMHMLAGDTLNAKISSPEGRLAAMIEEGVSREDIVRRFYLLALSRAPTEREIGQAAAFVSKRSDRKQGLEGFVWALLNSKEFLFNH